MGVDADEGSGPSMLIWERETRDNNSLLDLLLIPGYRIYRSWYNKKE
jgi:hypothetical protein